MRLIQAHPCQLLPDIDPKYPIPAIPSLKSGTEQPCYVVYSYNGLLKQQVVFAFFKAMMESSQNLHELFRHPLP